MDDIAELKKMARRALDYQEIQNLFSMHCYIMMKSPTQEMEKIWAKEHDDVCFSQNWGIWVGLKAVKDHYKDESREAIQKKLDEKRKWHPDIPNDIKYASAGESGLHTLTTPIIEVAGDGETAKGMWYTPGFMTMFNNKNGKWESSWMYELYAIDFIKEDGKWKIWHFCVCNDFSCPYYKSWADVAQEKGTAGTVINEISPTQALGATLPGHAFEGYHTRRITGDFPKPPEPYETFSETFSYAPR